MMVAKDENSIKDDIAFQINRSLQRLQKQIDFVPNYKPLGQPVITNWNDIESRELKFNIVQRMIRK